MPNQQIAHRLIICLRRFSSENGKASSEKAKKKDISWRKSTKKITCRFVKTHLYAMKMNIPRLVLPDIKEINWIWWQEKKEMNHETSCHQENFSASLHLSLPKTCLTVWTPDQTNKQRIQLNKLTASNTGLTVQAVRWSALDCYHYIFCRIMTCQRRNRLLSRFSSRPNAI